MKITRLRTLAVSLAVLVLVGPARAATVLERTFTYPPDRTTLGTEDGLTTVRVRGSEPELRAGRPDLPWITERVDLEPGQRIASVEVLSLETATLASGVRLPASVIVAPGLGKLERSLPDPRWFGEAAERPAAVELGAQGSMRGRSVGLLRVAPVRWNPADGRLERVSSVRVRLHLEPNGAEALKRERIVPEWETSSPAALRALAHTAPALDAKAGARDAQPFRATQLPSVLGSPVAYVIVTDDAQAAEYQRLADWKTASGVPAVVRTMSFIQQQYPFGSDDAERVRLFLRDAYTRWGTRWALLGGDVEVVPTRFPFTTYYYVTGHYIPCDLYYSCLDGNWNADGDSIYGEGYYDPSHLGDACDLLPDVYVGRAPTLTADDAHDFVDRTLSYEQNPPGDYERNILFFSEVLFPQNWEPGQATWLDGAELIEYDVLPVLDARPDITYGRLYENHLDPRWRPGSFEETRAAVKDSLSSGRYHVAVHVGHGYRNVMSVGDDNLNNQDALTLTNGSQHLVNLYAIDCTSNAIDFPSIGEAFLRSSTGGAVTNIGSTTLDFPYAGRAYQAEYFRLIYQDSVTAIGEAQAAQKLPFVSYAETDNVQRWTQMTLLLLGDPELRIWTGAPRTLNVVRPASIAASDSQLTVTVSVGATPLLGARVTAWKAGVEYRSVLTNGAGVASFPFRPDSAGTFQLTVTGYDCRPYRATVPITAASAPVLAIDPIVVDDDNAGGTSGNGNGQVDEGETVDLRIPVDNRGGSAATSVTGALTTTDGTLSIPVPGVSYGTIVAGGTSNPATGFRVVIPADAADQKELPFTLTLLDGAGRRTLRTFQLVNHAPEPRQIVHALADPTGDGDGLPDAGETLQYTLTVRNLGTGLARGVNAKLRLASGTGTVLDSVATFGDLAPGQQANGDPLVLVATSLAAKYTLLLYDQSGLRDTETIDLAYPDVPTGMVATGAATTIKVQWRKAAAADLGGYFLYRAPAAAGPFTRVNPLPTDRTAYYLDEGLAPLTRYYYKVSAVDSSGNESAQSAAASASTNPPHHAIFPVPMGQETPSSVALEHMYPGHPIDIVVGSDVLYVWHADGTAPVDADGGGSTNGDFTRRGSYYAAGPAIGDLDGDGTPEVVGAAWDSLSVYAFDLAGNVRPGWPILSSTGTGLWSTPALGDLDNDGKLEVVWGTNENRIYAVRWNGQELIDGDSNPATQGVFKVVGASYNFGSAAFADLDGNGQLDIVYGDAAGYLNAWRANGTNLPGFPVKLTNGQSISASPAIGYLDGPGDPLLDIVVPASNESLYVIQANGSRHTGFPAGLTLTGTSRTPSPALADMNNDGFVDIVQASTDGRIYVFRRTGGLLLPWFGAPYSPMTATASESSPVVADINGDGKNDVIMGDETGQLSALSGVDGQQLPGFPIIVGGEIRGTPGVCDCDGDGMTEVIVAGWDKNMYVWDYDFPFHPNGIPPWPQFHHDARRTGLITSPVFVDVADEPLAGGAPAALAFAPPTPNPARRTTRFELAIPAAGAGVPFDIGVFDVAGRRVKTIAFGAAKPGRLSFEWNLRDEGGAPVGNGVYFARVSVGAESSVRKFVVLH